MLELFGAENDVVSLICMMLLGSLHVGVVFVMGDAHREVDVGCLSIGAVRVNAQVRLGK